MKTWTRLEMQRHLPLEKRIKRTTRVEFPHREIKRQVSLCFRASEPSWVQCWATINNITHTNQTNLPKEGCTSTPNSPGERTPPTLTKTHNGTKQHQTALRDKLKNAGETKTNTDKNQTGWLFTRLMARYLMKKRARQQSREPRTKYKQKGNQTKKGKAKN